MLTNDGSALPRRPSHQIISVLLFDAFPTALRPIGFVVRPAAIVLFLIWVHKKSTNVARFAAQGREYTPWESVMWWLVPIRKADVETPQADSRSANGLS